MHPTDFVLFRKRIGEEGVKKILQITEGDIPLTPSTAEKESISIFGDLPGDRIPTRKLHTQTTRALARLQPREAEVLRMSFGLGKETTHTLEEVGRNLNLSREKIRQIQTRALRKLKNMQGHQLRLLNEP